MLLLLMAVASLSEVELEVLLSMASLTSLAASKELIEDVLVVKVMTSSRVLSLLLSLNSFFSMLIVDLPLLRV